MKDSVILYHKSCPDGFGSAWAAWKKFGEKANYIPVEHSFPPPGGLKNRDVYIVDFSYDTRVLKKIAKENKSLTVIDHHLSAEKKVKSAPNHLFDLRHSGAVLAWKYFHPKKTVPRLLLHVEDMDLWKFKLEHTKEISAALEIEPFDFERWTQIQKNLQSRKETKNYTEKGKTLLKYKERIIERILDKAELVEFDKREVWASNSPFFSSEIGHQLVRKKPPLAIVWSKSKGGLVGVSLRSNGKVDVSKIAQKFGGGGHKTAAGFSIKLKKQLPFPWKEIK